MITKKIPKKLSIASMLCLSTGLSAANVTFTGAGADQNFSTAGNWNTVPAENDTAYVRVGATENSPAIVDSALFHRSQLPSRLEY